MSTNIVNGVDFRAVEIVNRFRIESYGKTFEWDGEATVKVIDDAYEVLLSCAKNGVSKKLVSSDGGEGEGEYYSRVWEIHFESTDETFYVEIEGLYNSWEGVEFHKGCSGVYLVEPVPVEVIQYHVVK